MLFLESAKAIFLVKGSQLQALLELQWPLFSTSSLVSLPGISWFFSLTSHIPSS